MQPMPAMGIELICSQSLHVGFCFAAFCLPLRYKQYPTALRSGSGEGGLAFQERVTLWWPVCGEACRAGTPAAGQWNGLGSAAARSISSALEAFLDVRFAPGLTRSPVAISRNPYATINANTHPPKMKMKCRGWRLILK
jgi:hypothetical protein